MIPPLLALSQNRSKLKVYIAHLTDLCHDRDPSILSQLTPPSHYHHSDPEDWEEELQKMGVDQVQQPPPFVETWASRSDYKQARLVHIYNSTLSLQLEWELEVCEKESGELQEYANSVLQQIADYCPDILEQVVNALEESC